MTEPLDRIIWSADVDCFGEVERALDGMSDLRIIKIDRLMLAGATFYEIDRLNSRDVKVFVDAKLIEIPSKLEALAHRYCQHRPWMLNCMAGAISNGNFGGSSDSELDGLKRFADVCHSYEVRPCGVTVLTSKTERIVEAEFGPGPNTQALWYTEMLVRAGFTDVVCSPQEVAAIKANFGDRITINTPGVRMLDAQPDDQARVMTPRDAIEAGADRLVIGRPITQGDKKGNLARIVRSIT